MRGSDAGYDALASRVGAIRVRQALLAQGIAVGAVYSVGDPATDPFHESDPLAYVKSIRLACASDDGRTWRATVSYSEFNPEDWNEDPLSRPPIRWVEPVPYQAIADVTADVDPVTGDPDPKPVVNSAYDYFDPPILRDVTRLDWVVERNERVEDVDPALIEAYQNVTNDAVFWGYARGVVQCLSITPGKPQYSAKLPPTAGNPGGGGYYCTVLYRFGVNRSGWKARPLDQGLRRLVPGTPPERRQIEIEGSLATAPVLLDGAGDVLPVDGDPHYHSFLILPERDFAAFNFPAAWN